MSQTKKAALIQLAASYEIAVYKSDTAADISRRIEAHMAQMQEAAEFRAVRLRPWHRVTGARLTDRKPSPFQMAFALFLPRDWSAVAGRVARVGG